MSVLDHLHANWIYRRRVRRLSEILCEMIPHDCSLLDVGCGDGKLAQLLLQKRPDLQIEGVDVLVREQTSVPVKNFDGINLPYPDSSFDGATLIDVLHHTRDPLLLLREAARVSRRWLIVKDHVVQGVAAVWRLRLMDYAANSPHGVALPYNYFSRKEWADLRCALDVKVVAEMTALGLYPKPIDYVFGAGLHFVTLWERTGRGI
jgi:SAM-dependent methyltransferase